MTIATELPKGLITNDQIITAAFELMEKQLGLPAAAFHFCYDKDYPSDTISEYRYLQKNIRYNMEHKAKVRKQEATE